MDTLRITSMLLAAALAAAAPPLYGATDDPAAEGPAPRIEENLPPPGLAGRMPAAALPESSGLVRSVKHAGVFWTLNDSGNPPHVFAINVQGKMLRDVEVPGASNVDWEDLALDPQGRLLVGDFGNNARNRKVVVLYRIPEPDPNDAQQQVPNAEKILFKLPDDCGPQDIEALVTRGTDAYVFTKERERTRCYRLPLPEKVDPAKKEPLTAEFAGETRAFGTITAADLSPDGRHLALLTYNAVWVGELPVPDAAKDGEAPKPPAPLLPFTSLVRKRGIALGQCEGIAWSGTDLVLTNEKTPLLDGGHEVFLMRNVLAPAEQPGGPPTGEQP